MKSSLRFWVTMILFVALLSTVVFASQSGHYIGDTYHIPGYRTSWFINPGYLDYNKDYYYVMFQIEALDDGPTRFSLRIQSRNWLGFVTVIEDGIKTPILDTPYHPTTNPGWIRVDFHTKIGSGKRAIGWFDVVVGSYGSPGFTARKLNYRCRD